MINLPASLKVSRNKSDETRLLAATRKWLEKENRAEGLHASDLLDPRLAFWRIVDPKPLEDRLVPIFLAGKVLHSFVLGGLNGKVDLNATDEGTAYSEALGVHYSIDWDKSEIAEFKTTRSFIDPKSADDISIYLEQLLIYMCAKQRTTARLWVFMLNLRDPSTRKTSPAFRCYTVSVSEEELRTATNALRQSRDAIESALNSGDHRALPLCRDFKCGAGNCQWWDKCKPEGRYKEPV